jgi:hypothetical protein
LQITGEEAKELLQNQGFNKVALGNFTAPGSKPCKCKIAVYQNDEGTFIIDRDWCANHFAELEKLIPEIKAP